jgi:hypothetical protein
MDRVLIGMERIRAHPGLLAEIARALGITRAAVAKWARVPAERVLAVEGVTGISRHDLRPDIYPPPRPGGDERLAWSPPRRKHKNLSNAVV